jgi:hypothetical protein
MTEEQIIDDILDEFDFGKVMQVMEHLDWKWGGISSPPEVPSLGQLRKRARSLMKYCIGHDEYVTATGGFHVRKETFEGQPYYQLQFVVTDWNNYE